MEPTKEDYEENVKNFITTHLTPRNLDGIVTVEAFDCYPKLSLTIPGRPRFIHIFGVWRLIEYCGVYPDMEITDEQLFELLDNFTKENQIKTILQEENARLTTEIEYLRKKIEKLEMRPGEPGKLTQLVANHFESLKK